MKNLNLINTMLVMILNIVVLLIISLVIIKDVNNVPLVIGGISCLTAGLFLFRLRIKQDYVFILKGLAISLLMICVVYLTLPVMPLLTAIVYLILVSVLTLSIILAGIGFKAAITKTMPIV